MTVKMDVKVQPKYQPPHPGYPYLAEWSGSKMYQGHVFIITEYHATSLIGNGISWDHAFYGSDWPNFLRRTFTPLSPSCVVTLSNEPWVGHS